MKELIKIEYEVIYVVDKKFSDFVKGFSVWVYDDVFLFFYLGFLIIFWWKCVFFKISNFLLYI